MNKIFHPFEDGSIEHEYLENDPNECGCDEEVLDNSRSLGGGWVIVGTQPHFKIKSPLFERRIPVKDGSIEAELTEGENKLDNIEEDSIEEVLNQEKGERISQILFLLIDASTDFFEEELANLKEKERLERIERFDKSKEDAREFMEELSLGVCLPCVIPESNGSVALEWRNEGKGLLLVFSGENIISYAGYLGENNKYYGTKEISKKKIIPRIIKEYLYELFSTTV